MGAVRADSGSGCGAGALGAAIGELTAEAYGQRIDTVQLAALVGGLAVALTGGDATQINVGSQAGSNAAANNYLAHAEAVRLLSLASQCKTSCTPAQLEELAALFVQDKATTQAMQDCSGNGSPVCLAVRRNFEAVAASFLPNDDDIRAWSLKQSDASNGKYTPAQIYDAYRTSFLSGAAPDNTAGDLTEVADWMRDRITGKKGDPTNPGEGVLSKIAMGWAVGNSGSAQAALSVQAMALSASLKTGNKIIEAVPGRAAASTIGTGGPNSDRSNPEAVVAGSAKRAADLARHLGYAEKYGKAGVKGLTNGRIRYYGEVQPANNAGEMVGRRYVHEYEPETGRSRGWHETIDQAGNVRQVRPELNNGNRTHYRFDSNGKYTGSW